VSVGDNKHCVWPCRPSRSRYSRTGDCSQLARHSVRRLYFSFLLLILYTDLCSGCFWCDHKYAALLLCRMGLAWTYDIQRYWRWTDCDRQEYLLPGSPNLYTVLWGSMGL